MTTVVLLKLLSKCCYSDCNMKKIKMTPFLQNKVVRPFRINEIFRGGRVIDTKTWGFANQSRYPI
jgi:hypothetical protein